MVSKVALFVFNWNGCKMLKTENLCNEGYFEMNEIQNIDITSEDRELLLSGLSYLRSAQLYEIREPGSDRSEHDEKLRHIQSLVDLLNGAAKSSTVSM
jgi:hypothetical protein